MRKQIFTGTPWEDQVGYCRSIRVGNAIEVSGTTAMDGDKLIGKGDIYEQAAFIFRKIEDSLTQLDASMKDVVRTRMYVTDISQWQQAARAHEEVFKDIKPTTSMVEVSKLISPDLLIEIEVTAIIQ